MTRREEIVVIVSVALASVLLIASVVIAILSQGTVYIPIAAAAISGAATLGAITVAAMALRLSYRSQSGPLRVELYKKQIEAMSIIYEKAVEINYFISNEMVRAISSGENLTKDFYLAASSEMTQRIRDIELLRKKYDMVMPAKFQSYFGSWLLAARLYAQRIGKVSETGKFGHMVPAIPKAEGWKRLVNYMRSRLGTDRLSDEMLEVMGETEHKLWSREREAEKEEAD
jgi:hypothetical protein